MQAVRETILSLELPYRDRVEVERVSVRGGDGPRVAVVSGLHGDELEGLYLCHRVLAWLDSLSQDWPTALRGTVEFYPALNPLGLDTLQRGVPVLDADLNRSFPGHPEGLLPQRVADAALRALEGARLVIDVHASTIHLRELPQVRIAPAFAERLAPLARELNVHVAWIADSLAVNEGSLAWSLNQRGTDCLVVEAGVGMQVDPHTSERIAVGLLHTFRRLGVLERRIKLPQLQTRPLLADGERVRLVNAEASGVFVPSVEHWHAVYRDQLLGHIVSPYGSEVLSSVYSPVDGVLFSLRSYPLVYQGSLVARVAASGADGAHAA